MDEREVNFSIVRYMVEKLGNDLGKTKIQKLLYFGQYACGMPLNYAYRIHYFGPYSEELDDDMINMKLNGYLVIQPDPAGYGYHVIPGKETIKKMDEYLKPFQENINQCIEKFGNFTVQKLEIMSTLHYVEHVAGIKGKKNEIVDIVASLKPRYNKTIIDKSYDELKALLN
jgi:uncharacterized protein